ncbi:MAG: LysR family transcriptional regulator [Selenomonadaceae bacterium]|nr:LysR family transcriptional regulator [Selenomonadaceae bacterium]
MIDEHEWRSVLQVVADGTLSQAAKHLFVSQPSLSQCIKKIESELETPLFDRSQNPLKLTEAGEAYVKAAQAMQQISRTLRQQVDDLSELRTGEVRIGSSRTRSVCLLTGALVAFHRRYPGIKLSVVEGSTERLREHVRQGHVDFALLYEPLPPNFFASIPIMKERVLLAVPPQHPWGQKYIAPQTPPFPTISFARLHHEPFIALKANRRMFSIYTALCQNTQTTPQVVFEADSILSAAELCAEGMGATLVTDMVVKHGLACGQPFFFEIAEPTEERCLVAAYGKQQPLSRAARRFLDFLIP